MQKRLRDLLRVLVADLRHTLSGGPNGQRGDLDRELERLGIAPDGTVTPFDALPNPTPTERRARRVAEAQLAAAPAARRAATRAEVVERAAYTWINRLLALRTAEARGLINEILRSDPAYDGLSEALFILRQTQPQRAAGPDGGWWAVIEDACRAQAASLPGLFDLADPSAALRPSVPALLRCVTIVGSSPVGYTADEAEATFADPDAIGWAYQFYQEEAKTRTYAKLNSGGKAATRAEIAAVTQLFTEPYMVKWLLQNSLGRTYHELYPDSKLPETWEYYIRDLPRDEGAENLQSAICNLESITFMDVCMGSGHFEREAFDMYFAMYREQYPNMSATEIADRILTHHLHGIDLDPRAAQLAALTLYLRAWEMVRDERRGKRLPGPGSYRPPVMNLATTPTSLTSGSLERHLQRHPEDRIYRPLLEGIFAALEQADVLGSLLRPGEQLDAAIRAFRSQGGGQLGLLAEDDDLNRLLGELARHDPAELKRMLLVRIARSFAAEAADADDVAMSLFGREAGEGLRLLQLLDRQYTVVATNPPYMGSKNMDAPLRKYVETYYHAGKRDLYASFILRGLRLCEHGGRLAMVTQHSWMFLQSFADLRAVSSEQLIESQQQGKFTGLLRETTIEALAHLGPNAFEEISGHVVQTVLFVFLHATPESRHTVTTRRIAGTEQAGPPSLMLSSSLIPTYRVRQVNFLTLPTTALAFWVADDIIDLFSAYPKLGEIARVKKGLATTDNNRFIRHEWEISLLSGQRWAHLAKSGTNARWSASTERRIDWEPHGARVKQRVKELYHGASWSKEVRSPELYFQPGICYSIMAQGSLSARLMGGAIFENKSGAIFAPKNPRSLLALLNTNIVSFLLRLLSSSMEFNTGTAELLPVPPDLGHLVDAVQLKNQLQQSVIESHNFLVSGGGGSRDLSLEARLSCLEGYNNDVATVLYGISASSIGQIMADTGTPAGWYPLIAGYDSFLLPAKGSEPLPDVVIQHLSTHRRLNPDASELARIKDNLRRLYEAGLGAATDDLDLEALDHHDDEDEPLTGAYIPIPVETFADELSQKLQIHPISVYWLLEELRAEGVRCKPEELRLLEDRLSVLVLRLLGYRWPRQIEAGEPVPSWADPDGIIPLTAVAGEASLAERVRDRLRAEDGDRGAQQVEALLLELTAQTLDEWLRRTFFARHVRQFKHRPIAWHLASTPTKDGGRKKAKREPAYQCLLYYHACRGDVLARLRAHYVEPLIRLETAAAAEARRRGDETAAAIAVSRVQELEEFAARLREVEETGFACAELDRLLAEEPLDRWSGDGIVPPTNADELAAQERAWRVDINDGVRVNIAPLQLAGLLTSDVLRPDDARKAIADRARWRSDERRWVREGVLPRCGWMDEDVPESPRWTERAPEREAEQRKLEEKRRAVMGRLAGQAEELS